MGRVFLAKTHPKSMKKGKKSTSKTKVKKNTKNTPKSSICTPKPGESFPGRATPSSPSDSPSSQLPLGLTVPEAHWVASGPALQRPPLKSASRHPPALHQRQRRHDLPPPDPLPLILYLRLSPQRPPLTALPVIRRPLELA